MIIFMILFLFIITTVHLFTSLHVISEKERALVVVLGKAVAVWEAGPHFAPYIITPRFLYTVVRYPLQVVTIDIPPPKEGFISRRGKPKILGAENDSIMHGPANIQLDIFMFFSWPETLEDLTQTYKLGPPTYNKEELARFFENAINEPFRQWISERTWEDCTLEVREGIEFVLNEIRSDENNVIRRLHLQNIKLSVQNIELPDDLKKSLRSEEIGKLEALRAIAEAEAKAERIRLTGQAEAEAQKVLRESIFEIAQQYGPELEALLTLREMAQGSSNTILYGIPPGIADMLNNILGSGSRSMTGA